MGLLLTETERRSAMQTMAANPSPGADPALELFTGAWNEMRRFHNSTAEYDNRVAVVDAHIDRYEAATGERLLNPEWMDQSVFRSREKEYEQLREKFDAIGLPFPDDATLQAEAWERSGRSRDEVAALRLRATSWTSFFADLAGTMGGAMTDPVNVASMAFGAGWSRGILQTALIEAGVVGASQAAIEAGTWGYKRQVDPEWGVGEAGLNVVGACAVGTIYSIDLGSGR